MLLSLAFLVLFSCLPQSAFATASCETTHATYSTMCTKCASGYTLLLYSPYVTVCASVDTSTSTCTIDSTNYPTESAYQTTNSIVYDYYTGDGLATDYCFNCAEYYKRSVTSGSTTSTVEMCDVCEQQDLSTNFYENSAFSVSKGCAECKSASYPQMNVTYLSHVSLYMRECSAKGTSQSTACTITQTYSTKKSTCIECNTLYPNCAACNSTNCVMCPKGYYLHKGLMDYSTGKSTQDSCQHGVCPYDYCRDEEFNTCVKSTLTGCQICTNADSVQTCEICQPGYILDGSGTCTELIGTKDMIYYVVNSAPITLTDYTTAGYDPDSKDRGESISTPFYFIQEALSAGILYQESQGKAKMNVTIFLSSGDHFFFLCDGGEDYSSFTASTYVEYCTTFGGKLQQRYQINDEFYLTIKPLYCSWKNTLGYQTNTDFTTYCISDTNTKPTIYVNHAQAYFNISGSMMIENVKFSGINALVVPTTTSQDLRKFPVQWCYVTTEPNGYESSFKIAKKTGTKPDQFSFTCTDSWYTAPQRLDMKNLSRKCKENNGLKFNQKTESTLKCPGDLNDPDFFPLNDNDVYHKRRNTLFNLYAFPSNMSLFKLPPMLTLNKCDFEYFLGNYESLISVETANLQQITVQDTFTTTNDGTVTQTRPHFNFYGADKGIRLKIISSNFKNSRFCKGMIVYRKPLLVTSQGSLTNYTNIYSFKNNSDSQAYIAITRSNFIQLNIFTNVTAIAAYGGNTPNRTFQVADMFDNEFKYRAFMHKGIVINSEDFGGPIEISESQFTRNIHYISEAVVYPRKKTDQVSVEQFRDSNNPGEYKISVCNPDTQTDLNLFTHGINMDTDLDALFDKFERLSVIYISRNKKLMYFKNNRFFRNTGLFGGAITINSPNFRTNERPFVVVDSCKFDQNQAFIGGNGVYIRNTIKKSNQGEVCAGGYILNSNFTQNVGLKAHNGGAMSVLCEYIDSASHDDWQATSSMTSIWVAVDLLQDLYEPLDSVLEGANTLSVMSFKFNIENSEFLENYSGMKGTAIYFKQISKIRIVGTDFYNNGPTFSNYEYQYSGQTLYMSNRPISFYDPNEICLDEYQYMNDCSATTGLIVDFPRVKGAVHIQHCNEQFCINENDYQLVTISSCDFVNNDAGPYITSDFPSEDNAASLYINGGLQTTISRTKFRDHKGNWDYYTTNVAPKYGKFFPTSYYQYSHSPVIRINLEPAQILDNNLNFNTTFSNCNFTNNKHIQILGSYQDQKQYYGSLISYETSYTFGSKFLPVFTMASTSIRDNKFLGNQTSLIHVNQAYINLTNNTVYGNGYLSFNSSKKSPNTEIGMQGYTYYLAQQYGFLRLVNTEMMPSAITHIIRLNRFSYNFGQSGSVFTFEITGQFIGMESNTYRNNYALQGPSINALTQDTLRSTIKITNDTYDGSFGQRTGAITLASSQQNVISVLIQNSSFRNCFASEGSSIYAQNLAALIVRNATFWDTSFAINVNKTGLVQNSFTIQSWKLSELIELKVLSQLSDGILRLTGAVNIQNSLNTLPIMFGTNEFIRRSNYTFLQHSEFIDCSFENMTANSATAIYAYNNQQVRISNTQYGTRLIRNNKQQSYGSIKIDNNSTMIMENLTYNGNQAQEKAGAIYASLNSMINGTNTTFRLNDARESGGCIFLSDQSRLLCNNCTFINNTAKSSSVLYTQSNDQLPLSVSITNSQITNNTQDSSLMTIQSSNTLIENTTMRDNTARFLTHGLTVTQSNVIINNVTVQLTDQSLIKQGTPNVDVGFINLNLKSNLTVNRSSQFINLRASQASVIMAQGFSNVNIDGNTRIERCQSSTGGASISLQMSSQSIVRNLTMLNDGHIGIILDRSQLNITNSTFNNTQSNAIYAIKSNMSLINSTIMNSIDQLTNGLGIYCNCHSLYIENSSFQNLSALQGGAIYLTSSSEYSVFTIRNSTFNNNTAMQGGAIKLQDAYQLTLSGNKFTKNSARVINPSNQQSMRLMQKGQGGAINMDCNNLPFKLLQNCDVKIINKNIFTINYAENDGGAMIYTSNPFYSDRSNFLEGNYGEVYGDDLASYPKELVIEFYDNNDDTNRVKNTRSYYRNLQSTSSGEVIPTIVPGIPFSFAVYILDQHGYVYLSDSSSVASLTSTDKNVQILNGRQTAYQGVFNFSDTIIKVTPGTNVSIGLQTSGIQTYGNYMPKISTPLQIIVPTRACAMGEQLTDDNSCIKCDTSSYLFIAPTRATQCKPCPSEAICFGKNKVAPANGYWRWSNESDSFIECPNYDACLAGTIENPTGICAEGYTGILCGNCINGYRKSSTFECTKCPSMAANFFYLLILLLIGLAVSLVLVRANLFTDDKTNPTYSVYLKIIVSHFQTLGIIMNIQFNWPEELQRLQDGYAYFSGISQQIFSYDCFIASGGFSMAEDSPKIFQLKLVFFALLPLIILGGVALVWGVLGMIRKNFYDFKVKTVATTLVIFFIIHPSISRVYFQTFNCVDVDGEMRLREDLAQLCYDGRHMVEIIVFAIPSIFAWTFGVPIVLLIILARNKKTIAQMHQQSQLSKTDQHAVKELRMKYGFLITGYKTQIFFWEIVVICRKILLVMLTVFLTVVSSETQVLAGLLCLIVSMILHVKFEPYSNLRINRMEHYSLQVISLTIYAGMFYVTGHHYSYMQGNGVKWFFFFLIIIPNCAFFLHWLNSMKIEILKIALMRGKRMFKLVSCGLVDPIAFEKRYMMVNEDAISDRSQSYIQPQNKTIDTHFNPATPGIDQTDFDDIRGRKRSIRMKNGVIDNPSDDVGSSDSDFKKSLDFGKQRDGDPQFDTDKQSSGGMKPPKLNLEGIKLGFPAHMARRIPDELVDDGTTNNSIRNTRNRFGENSYTNGQTYRDQPSSYRKIFPEQILTQRGFREDNYDTSLTDRSRSYMMKNEHQHQQEDQDKKSPMFRQEFSRDEGPSESNQTSSEVDGARDSEIQLTENKLQGRDRKQNRRDFYMVQELNQEDIQMNLHDDYVEDIMTNPQSKRKLTRNDRSDKQHFSGSSPPPLSDNIEVEDYGEEIGDFNEEESKSGDAIKEFIGYDDNMRPSIDNYSDIQNHNLMQQTFKLKDSDAFELTMHNKERQDGLVSARKGRKEERNMNQVIRVNEIFKDDGEDEEEAEDKPKTSRRRGKKNFI